MELKNKKLVVLFLVAPLIIILGLLVYIYEYRFDLLKIEIDKECVRTYVQYACENYTHVDETLIDEPIYYGEKKIARCGRVENDQLITKSITVDYNKRDVDIKCGNS